MATAASRPNMKSVKEVIFEWEGKDRNGKIVRGELRAAGEHQVQATLRRQGILVTKVRKRRMRSGKKIAPKDIAIFTRQLATMMKAGVPLLQSFDIVGRGSTNPALPSCSMTFAPMWNQALLCHRPFGNIHSISNTLYCNLVEAGEAAGILEDLLDRLAIYMEKTEAIKSKIKSALMYPVAVIVVAFVVVALIMIFVIPAFKSVFENFGADLPAPTLFVIAMSEFFRKILVYHIYRNIWWGVFFSCSHGREMRKCRCSWIGCFYKYQFLAI